jgi:hypothetical protein
VFTCELLNGGVGNTSNLSDCKPNSNLTITVDEFIRLNDSLVNTNNLQTLFDEYFSFDAGIFSLILVSCMTIFAIGFSTGAMWKAWSKVM